MTRAEALILWGKHPAHGPLWLKLAEWESFAQMKRWERDGWKVVRLPKGAKP